MGERDDARGSIEETRDHMTEIVEELARRATPGYFGGQIKEATVNKTRELKERAGTSPTALAILGGVIGAALGAYVARSRSESREELPYYGGGRGTRRAEDVRGEGVRAEGMKEKAADTLRQASERSTAAVEQVRERAVHVKERARSGFSRAWDEQPLLVSIGFAVIGALVAVLAPVPEREKAITEPARRKAQEGMQKLGGKLESAIEGEEGGERVSREETARELPIEGGGPYNTPPIVH